MSTPADAGPPERVGRAEHHPRTPRIAEEVLGIVLATVIVVLALIYTIVHSLPILIAWEAIAVVHLALIFTRLRNRPTRDTPAPLRPLPSKLLEALSWVLPIAASGTGVTAAVTLLTTDGSFGAGDSAGVMAGVLGAIGVVIAWLMLQTGFAEIYEVVYARLPDSSVGFPGTDGIPTLSDFLYLSFTVGTSFAVAGATIASREIRRVILLHSVTSFFYNAFLIAIAIQVLQSIIAGRR